MRNAWDRWSEFIFQALMAFYIIVLVLFCTGLLAAVYWVQP